MACLVALLPCGLPLASRSNICNGLTVCMLWIWVTRTCMQPWISTSANNQKHRTNRGLNEYQHAQPDAIICHHDSDDSTRRSRQVIKYN